MSMIYTFTSVPSAGDQRDIEMNYVFAVCMCFYPWVLCSIMFMCIYGCIYVYSVCGVY